MIKNALLTCLFCLSVSAQRTPLSVNGTVVNNPNFTNTSSTGFTVSGANVSAHDKIWTNSAVQAGALEPVGGSNLLAPGTFRVIGQFTNDALQASTLPYVTATKALGSITLGTSGQVLTSAGAGVAPSFQDAAGGGDTIWTNDNGTISANSTVADGGTAFSLGSSNTLTSGNLVEVKNNGTNAATIGYNGRLSLLGPNNDLFLALYTGPVTRKVELISKSDDSNDPWNFLSIGDGTSTLDMGTGDNVTTACELITRVAISSGPYIQMLDTVDYNEYFRAWPRRGESEAAYVFGTSLSHTSGNLLEVPNNQTNKVWITFDGEVHAKDFVVEGSSFKTDTVSGHSGQVQVYDNDDATYRNVISWTNGNTPAAQVGGVAGVSLTVQPTILKSSDGTTGITTNITAGLVTFTIKNGLIVGVSL